MALLPAGVKVDLALGARRERQKRSEEERVKLEAFLFGSPPRNELSLGTVAFRHGKRGRISNGSESQSHSGRQV